ncbi:MAG TPA: flagellar motor switch protein FliG [bacterium]
MKPQSNKNVVSMNGVEKVAIFLIALGLENSVKLLKHLSESELEQVTVQIAKLKNLPSEVVTSVVLEYFEMMVADKYVTQGGITYAREMLEGAFGLDKARDLMKKVKSATEVTGFKLLQSIHPGELLNYLQKEHPQTIALILANMKHLQAAGILSELPSNLQGEVAYRLATMGKTSPELLQEIEEALTTQMGGSLGAQLSSSGGAKALALIMNSTSRSVETNIMEVMIQKDPELATEIKNLMFVFEDLLRLRDRDIQRVLKNIDSKKLGLALKVSSEDLRNKIFSNMSTQASEALREEIEYLGAVRLREVEEAQFAIVEQVREMENRGEIILSRSQEEEYVE